MRGFCKLLVFAIASVVPSVAMAENNAEVCHAQLSELDEARVTLDELEASVARMKAERSDLQVRDAELALELSRRPSGANGAADPQRKALVAERKAVQADLAAIAELLPSIAGQAKALRADVEAAERAYIGCIESTIQ